MVSCSKRQRRPSAISLVKLNSSWGIYDVIFVINQSGACDMMTSTLAMSKRSRLNVEEDYSSILSHNIEPPCSIVEEIGQERNKGKVLVTSNNKTSRKKSKMKQLSKATEKIN